MATEKNQNLYEIANDLSMIYTAIENADGEIPCGVEEILDSSELAFEQKIENIGKLIFNLAAREKCYAAKKATFTDEIKRLASREKTLQNTVKRLKEYVKDALKVVGKKKIEFDLFTFTVQNNNPSLDIIDEAAIPKKYIITTPTLDKKELLAALKRGEEIPGCDIDKSKTHIRLR